MRKTIVIDGLGLIGGSIALAIRQQWPEHNIIGVDINQQSLAYAKERGIITDGFTRLSACTEKADVIFLAAPVSIILAHMAQLARLQLKSGTIITDVGSTKKQILAKAALFADQGITFIGGHPMAGSHKTTIIASRADLFQSAYYFLISDTLTNQRTQKAADDLQTLLAGLNVKWQLISAVQHDQIVAQISHLPHILASGLVNMTQDEFSGSPLSLKLAAGGFRSLTRIASSDPEMWTDILDSNRQTLIQKIEQFSEQLQHVKEALLQSDRQALQDYFRRAKITRDSINVQAAKFAPNFYDLLVNIPDRSGSIAEVTKILAEAKISLVNIHILEIREEINGVLQLTFSNPNDLAEARVTLQQHDLSVVRGE